MVVGRAGEKACSLGAWGNSTVWPRGQRTGAWTDNKMAGQLDIAMAAQMAAMMDHESGIPAGGE